MNYQQNQEKMELKIYRRLLKYSPFSPKATRQDDRSMLINHQLRNGTITASAVECVSVSDAEKLFAAVYCKFSEKRGEENVKFKSKISEISKLTNYNDFEQIFKAIKRIAGLTIEYDNRALKKIKVFHIINSAEFNRETGDVEIVMPMETFDAFLNKALTLNLKKYIELRPLTKNLYAFLISNSANYFREDLLLERAASAAVRKDKAQEILKKAFVELKNKNAIKDFKYEKKGGIRYIFLEKIISVAGGKTRP